MPLDTDVDRGDDGSDVDDLATLSKLDNQILVDQLQKRYNDDRIYTYVGDILVAVNPFRPLDIYSHQNQKLYDATLNRGAPPHIYAVADAATYYLRSSGTNQCCIVSGESGAGKTESAKYVIRQLILLCRDRRNENDNNLEERILHVNPIMEAFGNAMTVMNDNSSRFGKYTELVFDRKGTVIGAKISEYLLEKSRVVYQAPGERNFHFLSYVFCYPEAKSKYGLTNVADFTYVASQEHLDTDEEGKLFELFAEVMTAFSDVGFSLEERDTIFATLAAVLHMGNVEYESDGDEFAAAKLAPGSRASVEAVSNALKLAGGANALEKTLLERVNITRGERVVHEYTAAEAADVRDATAKAMYGRLFSWLVRKINVLLEPPAPAGYNKRTAARAASAGGAPDRNEIGILDIYGFECFEENSFEQICINLANEYLQFFFNRHIFELELEEYKKEGVSLDKISYEDNKPVLDMFMNETTHKAAKGSIGLLALLDEECTFPKATPESLVNKFVSHFKDHKSFVASKRIDGTFAIKHYAGQVEYTATSFMEKNRDPLPADVVTSLLGSDAVTLFWDAEGSTKPSGKRAVGSGSAQNTANRRTATVGSQYKTSLKLLIDKMSKCRPHFVRCIKPNMMQQPHNFQADKVLVQLKYTGMLETTRIRREGYAVRSPFSQFIQRFRALSYAFGTVIEATSGNCRTILDGAGVKGWVMGKTKVFMKYHHLDQLEDRLRLLRQKALVIQKWTRGFLARKWTRSLLAESRRQRDEAKQQLKLLQSLSASAATLFKTLAEEDTARLSDRRVQMLEESRRALTARKNEAKEKAAAEKKRLQAERDVWRVERDACRLELAALTKTWHALHVPGRESDPETAEALAVLIAAASARKALLDRKLAESDQNLTRLKLQLDTTRQSWLADGTKRDVQVRQLIATLSREGSGAAADAQRYSLRKLDESLVEKRAAVEHCAAQVDHLSLMHSGMQGEAEEVTEKLFAAVQRNMSLLETVLAARESAVSDAQAAAAEQGERAEASAAELAEVRSEQGERAEASAAELAEVRSGLQVEMSRLELELDGERTANAAAKQEMGDKLDAVRSELETMEQEMAEQGTKSARGIQEAQAKHTQVAEAHAEAEQRHQDAVQKLKAELRSKATELEIANTEKLSALAELTSKVEAGEAEAAAKLRTQLRAERTRAEAAEMGIEEEVMRTKQQARLLETAKAEFVQMIGDLKRVIEQQNAAHSTLISEKEAARGKMEMDFQDLRAKAMAQEDGQSSTINQLQMELAEKTKAVTNAISEGEAVAADAATELEMLHDRTESQASELASLKAQVERSDARAEAASNNLKTQSSLAETSGAESERTIATLQQALLKRTAAERAAAAEHAQTVQALQGQLSSEQSASAERDTIRNREYSTLQSRLEAELASAHQAAAENQQMATESAQAIAASDALEQAKIDAERNAALAEAEIARLSAEVQQLQSALAVAQTNALVMEEEAVQAPVDEYDPQEDARQRDLATLRKPIRLMGRQPTGPSSRRNDGADVDLEAFVKTLLPTVPSDILVNRYTCKGYLSKLAGNKHWQDRWIVFDLRSKTILWFIDDRELKISHKGSIPMIEVLAIEQTEGGGFEIVTKKRSHYLIAPTPEATACWELCLGAVAKRGSTASTT